LRWLLAGMFAVPALNWLSTQAVLEALRPSPAIWLLITSANGVCVIILFAAYLWYGISTRLAERKFLSNQRVVSSRLPEL
jgi:hypothetical protein